MLQDGLVTVRNSHDFNSTLDRLSAALKEKHVTVFASVDHAAGAESVGMTLRPTTVVIFGNPAAGTPLMQAQQMAGIDLPLKILVWQSANGAVNLTYNDPSWIAARHALGGRTAQKVTNLTNFLRAVSAQAAGG